MVIKLALDVTDHDVKFWTCFDGMTVMSGAPKKCAVPHDKYLLKFVSGKWLRDCQGSNTKLRGRTQRCTSSRYAI